MGKGRKESRKWGKVGKKAAEEFIKQLEKKK